MRKSMGASLDGDYMDSLLNEDVGNDDDSPIGMSYNPLTAGSHHNSPPRLETFSACSLQSFPPLYTQQIHSTDPQGPIYPLHPSAATPASHAHPLYSKTRQVENPIAPSHSHSQQNFCANNGKLPPNPPFLYTH